MCANLFLPFHVPQAGKTLDQLSFAGCNRSQFNRWNLYGGQTRRLQPHQKHWTLVLLVVSYFVDRKCDWLKSQKESIPLKKSMLGKSCGKKTTGNIDKV